jgi:predicted phosphodiesterase
VKTPAERLAVVSDIHGNLPALEAVGDDIARERVDAVVNLGDIVSGPLWPAETAMRLMQLDWATIRGNHERQVLAGAGVPLAASDAFAARVLGASQRDWLAALPATRWLADDVFACHGTPTSDLVYFLETPTPDLGASGARGIRAATAAEAAERAGNVRAALLLCGHTHTPRCLQLPGGRLVVNPGSVGLQAYDDDYPHPHRVENGSPHARYAIVERTSSGWSVQLRAVAYDWETAARRAEAGGRGDWADALRTGRVGRLEAEALASAAPPAPVA